MDKRIKYLQKCEENQRSELEEVLYDASSVRGSGDKALLEYVLLIKEKLRAYEGLGVLDALRSRGDDDAADRLAPMVASLKAKCSVKIGELQSLVRDPFGETPSSNRTGAPRDLEGDVLSPHHDEYHSRGVSLPQDTSSSVAQTPTHPPHRPQEDSNNPMEESVAAATERPSRRTAPTVERLRGQLDEAHDDVDFTLRTSKGAHGLSVNRVRKLIVRLQDELFSFEEASDSLSSWFTSNGAASESSLINQSKDELSHKVNARLYYLSTCAEEKEDPATPDPNMESPTSALRKSSVVTFSDPVVVKGDQYDKEYSPSDKPGYPQKLPVIPTSTGPLLDLVDSGDLWGTQLASDTARDLLGSGSGILSVSTEHLNSDVISRSTVVNNVGHLRDGQRRDGRVPPPLDGDRTGARGENLGHLGPRIQYAADNCGYGSSSQSRMMANGGPPRYAPGETPFHHPPSESLYRGLDRGNLQSSFSTRLGNGFPSLHRDPARATVGTGHPPHFGPGVPAVPPLADQQSSFINPLLRRQVRYDLLRGIGDPFDGTPEHFWSWRNQLSIHLAEADCGPLDTLYVMLHNTSGLPKDLVQNLINTNATDPAVTLQIAWYDLERRFGSETAIARRLLNKLDAFPKIKSPSQTVQMEGLLSLCRSIMGSMQNCSELGVLNYRSGLQRIWEKMPETFINRWRREFIRSVRNNRRTPDLTDLFQSISDFVEEHTDPNFFSGASYVGSSPRALQTNAVADGSPRLQVDSLDQGQASPRRESTRGTSSTCLYHQLPGHLINVCERFRALPLDDRRIFASKHSLCYRCLGPHMAKNCDNKTTCPLCSGNHCKAMHRFSTERTPDVIKGGNPNFTPVQARNNCTVVCNVKGTTNYCCSKTVPVLVRLAGSAERIKVFCIIDEQSNISFCDPALPSLLGAATKSTSYSLTTMSGTKSAVNGFTVADIEVRGFGEDAWITLPDLLTHPYIPDTSSESATMDIVNAHPHVRHLAKFFPRERPDLKVMLLLGVNSGAALGTKPYGTTYPYVHHTSLGWALVGPVRTEEAAKESSFKSLRSSATLNDCEQSPVGRQLRNCGNLDLVPSKSNVVAVRGNGHPGKFQEDSRSFPAVDGEMTVMGCANLRPPRPLKKDSVLPSRGKPSHWTKSALCRVGAASILLAWFLFFVCLCSRSVDLPSPGATSLTLALGHFSAVQTKYSLCRPECDPNFVETEVSLGGDSNWAQLLEDPPPYLKSKIFPPNASNLAGIWKINLVHLEPLAERYSFWLHWCDTSNPVSYLTPLSSSVTLHTGSDCCDVSAIRRPRPPTRGWVICLEIFFVERYSFWSYWCDTSNPVSCSMPLSSVTLPTESDYPDWPSPSLFFFLVK